MDSVAQSPISVQEHSASIELVGTHTVSQPAKAAPVVTVPSADYKYGRGIAFVSPSKNIRCYGGLDPVTNLKSVECSVSQHDWPTPPRTKNCQAPDRAGASIQADGRTATRCGNDPLPNDSKVLPIGSRLKIGSIACTMTTEGVACLVDGNGFRVGRTVFELGSAKPAPKPVVTVPSAAYKYSYGTAFVSPSKNIRCYGGLDPVTNLKSVECSVSQHAWALPPRPANCTNVDRAGFSLQSNGTTAPRCGNDPLPNDSKVLPIGSRVMIGSIACTMTDTGVTCSAGGHGFRLGRTVLERF